MAVNRNLNNEILNNLFKEIYTEKVMNEAFERIRNQTIYGLEWTDLELIFGGPEILNKLKQTKLFKLAEDNK